MTPGQKILAKLLVSNELLSEAQCANVFKKVPEPEEALRRLIKGGHLKNERIAKQITEMFQQQVATLEQQLKPNEEKPPAESSAGGEKPVQPSKKEAPADKPTAEKSPAKPKQKATTPAPAMDKGAKGKELVQGILKTAREMGASDVHITSGLSPVLRWNTQLREMEMPPLSAEVVRESLLSLVDDGRREHFNEHNDLDFCYDGGEEMGRFRTNYFSEQNGMNGVFRLVSATVPSLEELGMPVTVEKFTTYAVGIVLVTGPKACGKTTTLASMVDLINRTRSEHIITIEDPIEFVHPCKMGHVNQREVGSHTKSFGNALRAALREAPDVIMVGEMRDLETTSLAVSAAETGHLVLATLHTPDAIRTIGRVLDVFPPKEQGQIRGMLSESLRGVVSQQLVPSKDGEDLHLALEILVNTSAIGNMIREDRTFQLRGNMQTGKRLGMVLLDDSLVKLVHEGKIEPQEAIMRASDADYVIKELGSAPKHAS